MMMTYFVIIVVLCIVNILTSQQIVVGFMCRKNTFYAKAHHYRLLHHKKPKEKHLLLDRLIKKISGFKWYEKAEVEIRKAGYIGHYHPITYIMILAGVPLLLLLLCVINDPSLFFRYLLGCIAIIAYIKIYIKGKTRKITDQFEKHAWRIYRYLHNQIASGIKITDAITTVYETVDDKDIREILIKFAATFQLTMDIEESLQEINRRFGGNEAATLCMALREGVKTGDSELMLKRQEDVMFNKYFNRLEAETEKSRTYCILSAVMFCSILIILASVPVVMDLIDAMNSIFIS